MPNRLPPCRTWRTARRLSLDHRVRRPALSGHRARRRGRLLRDLVPAPADLRPGRRDRLRRGPVRRGGGPRVPRAGAGSARQALTDEAVGSIIEPTLDEVLSGGRFEIISIGFVIALWSGSRALNVLVDAITIMYGMAGERGIVRTRALSFGLYLLFLLVGVVVLPAGPCRADPGRQPALPARLGAAGIAYWPIVLVGTIGFLTTLFHVSVPGADPMAGRPPRGGADPADLVGAAARLLRLILSASAGSPIDLRTARRPDRLAVVAVLDLDGDSHRRRLQRRRGRGLAGAVGDRARGRCRSRRTRPPCPRRARRDVQMMDVILSG